MTDIERPDGVAGPKPPTIGNQIESEKPMSQNESDESQKRSVRRPKLSRRVVNIGDRNFTWLLKTVAWCTVALFVGMILYIGQIGWLSLKTNGFGFFIGSDWNPPMERFGAAPFLVGTIASSLIAILIATPVSVGTALFLKELAPRRIAAVVGFLVELLAAIPSVVYGLWGVLVLAPIMRDSIQPVIAYWLGPGTLFATGLGHGLTAIAYPFLIVLNAVGATDVSLVSLSDHMTGFAQALLDGPPLGLGLMTAGIVLAIMIIPTVTAISREVFMTVPDAVREGALGLGATRWEMIRLALLKSSRAGLIGAIILGLGRAIGETMAVTMVIGNRNEIPKSLFEPAQTMASVIANEYNESDGLHLSSLALVGLTLFFVSLMVNLLARAIVRWLERGVRA